jgi:hypothetical protein
MKSGGNGHQTESTRWHRHIKFSFRDPMLCFKSVGFGKRAWSRRKVFCWTAMQQKILTADNLASRGMQHNPLCPLCNAFPEDARHLLINYELAKEVLRLMWNWCHFQGSPSTCPNDQDPASWIAANAARADPANARRATGSLVYCWWNLWKERNKRIFDYKHCSEFQVAFAAKEEFELYLLAWKEFQPP